VLRPLDEHHRVWGEERVEQARVLVPHPGEPVEVEVRDRPGRAVIGVADDERRARDRPVDAERPQRPAHERRLARPQLARDEHDVAGPQAGRQVGARPLGGLGTGRLARARHAGETSRPR
jgi:hypothetical protein